MGGGAGGRGAFSLAAFSLAAFSEAVAAFLEAVAAFSEAAFWSEEPFWSEGVTKAMAAAVVVVIMVAEELALEAVAGMGAAMTMVGLADGSAGTVPAAAMRCSSLVTHAGL